MRTFTRHAIRNRWVLPWVLLMASGAVARAEKTPTPDSAMERLGQGDAVGARREYEALLSKRPDDPRLAFNAGLAAYRHQDWEGAARHFESALGSSDLQLQQRAFLALGNSRSRQGETAEEVADKTRLWEDAVQQYQAALGLNPADTDARFNLEAVQEQLSRLPKPEQDQKDQKDPKNQKDSKDQKGSKDQKDQKDSKDQKSEEQEKQGQDEKKPEDGKSQDQKSQDGQHGKQQDSKDSKQQGMGGQDSKKEPGAGKDKKPEKGQSGDPDGKDPKEQEQSGKDGKDSKQGKDSKRGEKGAEGKEGQSGEAGEEGQARPGQPGTAGRGQPGRDAGEDSVDGRMAVRFAERLLDGHKQDEKALIWRPANQAREPQRGADGRRKTW